MFNVIFEVQPRSGRSKAYLELAAHLKPLLETIDGFIDNERFASAGNADRILSLSTWRDEKALVRWRTHGEHHRVQERGRGDVFEDYHLRVGEVMFDSEVASAAMLPQDRLDHTQVAGAKFISLTEVMPWSIDADGSTCRLIERLAPPLRSPDLVDHQVFESLYNRGKICLLMSWKTAKAAEEWSPPGLSGVKTLRHRIDRVIRDYGMRERREAPQYYPEAPIGGPALRTATTGDE